MTYNLILVLSVQHNVAIFVYTILRNDHHTKSIQHSSPHTVNKFLFLVMRTFKICCLSNLQIYNTVLLTLVTMSYIISPWHLLHNWKFFHFDHLHPFYPSLTLCLWQPWTCSLYLWVHFVLFIYLFICLFAISLAAPAAYGGSQARGPVGAVAASLLQSHSNAGSESSLQPTPQLTATLDP